MKTTTIIKESDILIDFLKYLKCKEINVLDVIGDDSFTKLVNNYLNKQKNGISFDIIETVKWLHTYTNGNIVFCGSLGLALNGMLNRSVNDIDAILLNKDYFNKLQSSIYNNNKSLEFSVSGDFYLNDQKVECLKVVNNSINCDIFKTAQEIKYVMIDFYGIAIKIQTPLGAIQAKKSYLESNQLENASKHEADLKYIESLFK